MVFYGEYEYQDGNKRNIRLGDFFKNNCQLCLR